MCSKQMYKLLLLLFWEKHDPFISYGCLDNAGVSWAKAVSSTSRCFGGSHILVLSPGMWWCPHSRQRQSVFKGLGVRGRHEGADSWLLALFQGPLDLFPHSALRRAPEVDSMYCFTQMTEQSQGD